MSPEQLTNPKGVDHRSDIWSLGVILYELLSGEQPFVGESVPEIIGGILSNHPDGVRTLRADVPVGLEAGGCKVHANEGGGPVPERRRARRRARSVRECA